MCCGVLMFVDGAVVAAVCWLRLLLSSLVRFVASVARWWQLLCVA